MSRHHRVRVLGVGFGLALVAALGMTWLIAAQASPAPARALPLDTTAVASAEQLGKAFSVVAARARPAVVSVYSEKLVKFSQPNFGIPFGDEFFRQFFGQEAPGAQPRRPTPREYRIPQHGTGSGMILDAAGHILTNNHVIADVDEIKVQLADKRTFEAEIVSADPQTDVAVIKIKGAPPPDLAAIEIGDSDAIDVGDLVMAVGAPFGYVQTVTTGIISAKGRSGIGINAYEDFLQTDAAINPGNSGGPLVNMRGQVVGVNSVIATSVGQFSGVGFAIPINMVKAILPTLLKGDRVTRGMLGVLIQEVSPDLARQFGLGEAKGALVSQVNEGSGASKGGLVVGDVIVRYDGREVQDSTHLRTMVAATAPGKEVKVAVLREGKDKTVSVVIGTQTAEKVERPAAAVEGGDAMGRYGLTVQPLTPELGKQLGYTTEKGALISDVQDGSPAAVAGVQPGDLILEANHLKVGGVEDLKNALARSKDKKSLLLLVKHRGANLYVVLRLR